MKIIITGTFFTILIFLQSACVEKHPENPIEIGTRLELFVDHHLIDTIIGAKLKLHKPRKMPLSGFPSGGYMTVIKEDKFYRLYYRKGDIYHYAESKDGITWEKPELGILEGTEGRKNAILESHNLSPFLDSRLDIPEDERYKALGRLRNPEIAVGGEDLYAYASHDGIHWRVLSDKPVIKYDSILHWAAFDSQNVSFWSEAEQCYVAYFRHFNTPHDASHYGWLRTIGRAISKDFLNWTDESANFETPNLPGEHLYTNQTHPYFRAPHIYIALPTRFAGEFHWEYPRSPHQRRRDKRIMSGRIKGKSVEENVGSTDIMFMTSRAGNLAYERLFKEAFMRPGLDPERWEDRANYVALNVVPTGEREMSIYHTRNGHRYVLRTDGFVSVNAPYAGGELITKPLIFEGEGLILNLSTSIEGGIRVELQTADGEAIPGFSLADCEPIIDDRIEHVVSWSGDSDISKYSGRPIRIRFVLKDSDIYSFRFR